MNGNLHACLDHINYYLSFAPLAPTENLFLQYFFFNRDIESKDVKAISLRMRTDVISELSSFAVCKKLEQ